MPCSQCFPSSALLSNNAALGVNMVFGFTWIRRSLHSHSSVALYDGETLLVGSGGKSLAGSFDREAVLKCELECGGQVGGWREVGQLFCLCLAI